jgi:hypothetical protein
MELNSFGSRLLGWEPAISVEIPAGLCQGAGQSKPWVNTKAAAAGFSSNSANTFTPMSVTLINGDNCTIGDWVVWIQSNGQSDISRIGCVAEIVQLAGSPAQRQGLADFILVSRTIIGEPHNVYKMRRLEPIPDEYLQVLIKVSVFCSNQDL